MHATLIARIDLESDSDLPVGLSATDERVVVRDGASIRVLDAHLHETNRFALKPYPWGETILCLDHGCVVANETGITLYSFAGRRRATLPLEPWGGGCSGSVALAAGKLWSAHIPEGSSGELAWELARLNPRTLEIEARADLSKANADVYWISIRARGSDALQIELLRPPDLIGTITVDPRATGIDLGPMVPPDSPDEIAISTRSDGVISRGLEDLFWRDASGAILASATLRSLFTPDESGAPSDDVGVLVPGPNHDLWMLTNRGFLGRLSRSGTKLELERVRLPGISISRSSMLVSNPETGFDGPVTTKATNTRSIVSLQNGTRLLTVHAANRRTPGSIRLWGFE